jgi:phage tail sheath protein FI
MALTGGVDGLSNLKMRDFTGDLGANERHGIRALELAKDVSLVAIPDAMIRPEPRRQSSPLPPPPEPDPCLPGEISPEAFVTTSLASAKERAPEFSDGEIYQIQQALVLHCELMGDRVALLDPPPNSDLQRILDWRSYFDSSYAGLYYPWLLVREPRPGSNDIVREIPPSGHVAGVIARTDLSFGVHQPPANAVLRWAQGLTEPVPAEYQAILNPVHVNALRSFNGRGLRVYGARTVSSDPSLRFLNVRRVLLMLRKVLMLSLQWAVFEPHDFYLRERVRLSISSFLQALRQAGALAGATPEESFFVQCDGKNNPPEVVDDGQLVVDVGVAIVRPAEFVVFRIGRTRDELEITELAG